MVRIQAPATTANLGAGFDCLGCALSLYNTYEIEEIERGYEITGCGAAYALSLIHIWVIASRVVKASEMECERMTGTRTQVQHTLSSGRCRIFLPSFCIFISSVV